MAYSPQVSSLLARRPHCVHVRDMRLRMRALYNGCVVRMQAARVFEQHPHARETRHVTTYPSPRQCPVPSPQQAPGPCLCSAAHPTGRTTTVSVRAPSLSVCGNRCQLDPGSRAAAFVAPGPRSADGILSAVYNRNLKGWWRVWTALRRLVRLGSSHWYEYAQHPALIRLM